MTSCQTWKLSLLIFSITRWYLNNGEYPIRLLQSYPTAKVGHDFWDILYYLVGQLCEELHKHEAGHVGGQHVQQLQAGGKHRHAQTNMDKRDKNEDTTTIR